MGRINSQHRHSIRADIEVDAPNPAEASRRLEEAVEALQLRLGGAEIYGKTLPGTRSGNRLTGRPRFLRFILQPGRPTQVDPFEHIKDDPFVEESVVQTLERYRGALESLETMQGEVIPVVNDGMVPTSWVLEVVDKALRPGA